MTKKTMKKNAINKPLAPQIEQLASFDLTVITSVLSEDDTVGQKNADISIFPYIEEDEEALEPPQENQRIEQITKYRKTCGTFTLKALKVSVVLVLVVMALVFLVVLIKSGKAFGKW